MKNVALIGPALFIMATGPGPFSLDARAEARKVTLGRAVAA